ncbi:MAG: radical SAM protein [Clostridia bacterium]|nr:radical SAM protein [Clostridia bacterium]
MRKKEFIVNGQNYIFNGDSVNIIVNEKNNKEEIYKEPNSHRSSSLKTLCLVINNCCNLCCEYCFANKGNYDKPNQFMTFEIARKAIDFLIKDVLASGNEKITISFFGGEPLLNFSLIRECVQYIEEFDNIKCKYMITTNGTLLTPQIVRFLHEYKFDVMISIDGNKEMHDIYRKDFSGKGSYADVVRGIKLFDEIELLNARITINNYNFLIDTYIDDILKLGIKRITFAVDYNISKESFELFVKSLKKLIDKYYNDIISGNLYEITNFSSIITTIALHQRKLTFCNAGISYITVSADGKYYKCPRFVGKRQYLLSNIEEQDKIKQKIKQFSESLGSSPGERNKECNKCAYMYICGGMCYHHAAMLGKKEFENVERECYQRKVLFSELIQMLCKLPIENRRKLLLFYIKLWNKVKGGKKYDG